MKLYVFQIPDTSDPYKLDSLVSRLEKQIAARINRIIRQAERQRVAMAELLLRFVVWRETGVSPARQSFSANEYGKPFMNGKPDFQFNLSHSGQYVVCCTSHQPVGIDVQLVKPVNMRVAERFFAPEEYEQVARREGYSREHSFIVIWSLKESYIKMIGRGFSQPLRSFAVSLDERDHMPVASLLYSSEPGQAFFRLYPVGPDYSLAVCSPENDFTDHLESVTSDQVAALFYR